MTDLALVTGASSGIGRELARHHAKKGGDLIVAARSEDALRDLKSELESAHGVTVHLIAADLGAPGGADALADRVEAEGHEVDILINNAGFGGQGRFIDRDLAEDQAMIDLNVKALVTLSHRFARPMVARGRGRILNVGSSAGFMPGPMQAIYFATKAFVGSFSQALAHELRKDGVTVTVLTPGYVETGFADRADLHGTGLTKQKGVSAAETARIGYDAMMQGKLVAFNETKIAIAITAFLPFAPRRLVLSVIERMQSK